jgi:alpha-N-arabinofuranosidase
MAPKWFLTNSDRYDNYPRTGPKVFSGEYAAQSVGGGPDNRNAGNVRWLKLHL